MIIGGAITVLLLMGVFSAFASPYLDFMASSEYLKNFNKFTLGLSTACDKGTSTQSYISLFADGNDYFTIGALGTKSATYLNVLSDSIVDKDSKERVKKCIDSQCYCLLKIASYPFADLSGKNVIVKEVPHQPAYPLNSSMNLAASTWTYPYDDLGFYTLAQGFRSSTEGVLSSVWLNTSFDFSKISSLISGATNTKITVSIYSYDADGYPDSSNVLASVPIPFSQFESSKDGLLKVDFNTPVYITQLKTYFIVVNSSFTLPTYSLMYWNSVDSPSFGNAFYFDTATGKWAIANGGSTVFNYAVTVTPLSTNQIFEKWDNELKDSLSQTAIKDRISVLQCRKIADELGCEADDGTLLLPAIKISRLPSSSLSEYYPIMWLKPGDSTSLKFDSYTFVRPIDASGNFENIILSYTSPELTSRALIASYMPGLSTQIGLN
ncbi:MAG: hypothetical protein PHH61_01915 [Candidatus Nanoarchaeia archaeon]|nr:hypothetical protein [Candidatus Nanoarchaeia archaeon]